MRNSKLTEEERAWLCSCSSYAKTKKPELTVMATRDVEIMLHNRRYEIEKLKALLFKVSEQIYEQPELEQEIQSALD